MQKTIKIRTGILLPGSESVGTGSTNPLKGIAATTDGEVAVIAKKVSPREIAVEIICAALGRSLEIQIPEPILLSHDNDWFFGSIYEAHPNFAQYISSSGSALEQELAEWPGLTNAACFDELVANPDRNHENLLYDGNGFFLIDHGLCLPLGMHSLDQSEDYYYNMLLELKLSQSRCELDSRRTKSEVGNWVTKATENQVTDINSATTDILTEGINEQLTNFLRQRINALASILEAKLNPNAQPRLVFDAEPRQS